MLLTTSVRNQTLKIKLLIVIPFLIFYKIVYIESLQFANIYIQIGSIKSGFGLFMGQNKTGNNNVGNPLDLLLAFDKLYTFHRKNKKLYKYFNIYIQIHPSVSI